MQRILKTNVVFIFIAFLLISCKNENRDKATTHKISIEKKQKNSAEDDSKEMIEQLQGKWREPGYPFRTAEFKDAKVKFIEEGIVEEPTFKKFEISSQCSYNSNKIQKSESRDLYILMGKSEPCQKIKIFQDSLILSGVDQEYSII